MSRQKYLKSFIICTLCISNNFFLRIILVSLSWQLHFEFVTSTHKGLNPPSLEDSNWQAPSEVPIETMVWNLPIRLYSTTPIQVAQGVQTNDIYKLSIR